MEYVGSAENETFALLKDLGLNPACETSAGAQRGGKKEGRKLYNLFEVVQHTKTGHQMWETRKKIF